MLKLDYLKLALTQSTVYNELKWIVKAFAIPVNATVDDSWKKDCHRYDLVNTMSGYSYIDLIDNVPTLVKIDDYVADTPLFTFQDAVTVDSTWAVNISNKVTTKIGNLIVNAICIAPVFKKKLDFIAGQVKVTDLEAMIANKLKDPTDKDITESDITVDEMVEFVDRIYYLTNFSMLTNISATPKNITISPEFKAKKQELLKKYEGQLTDPVKLVELEKELVAADDDYLAGDPTVGKVLVGKTKNIARKKMYLIFGHERGFNDTSKINPIINSLEEGWSTDKEQFSSYINALRSGSYSRGKETELGGVTYKRLQKSLSGLVIADEDCGTTQGYMTAIDKTNYTTLIYREIKVDGKWLHIGTNQEAAAYIDKTVELRSAMYCRYEKGGFCYHCLSSSLKDSPTGMSILASELSSVVLSLFMSMMHGVALSTTEIKEKDLFV
jgi:hypothetical protein